MHKIFIFLALTAFSAQLLLAATDRELYDKHWKEGAEYFDQEKYSNSVDSFTKAIKYYPQLPGNYGSYVNRGNAYSMLGQIDLAISDYTKVIGSFTKKSDKRLGEVYYNKGEAYKRNGKPDLAVKDYERAIELDPEIQDVHNKLAWLLATCSVDGVRNGKKAVKYALVASGRVQNKDPAILDTLAAAYAENGDFENATITQKAAIELLSDDNQKEDYGKRLVLYEGEKPFHQENK